MSSRCRYVAFARIRDKLKLDVVLLITNVLLIEIVKQRPVRVFYHMGIVEVLLHYHLIKKVELLNSILSNFEAILIKNGFLLVIDHLSNSILSKAIVRLCLV
jgi:hypothetical protein